MLSLPSNAVARSPVRTGVPDLLWQYSQTYLPHGSPKLVPQSGRGFIALRNQHVQKALQRTAIRMRVGVKAGLHSGILLHLRLDTLTRHRLFLLVVFLAFVLVFGQSADTPGIDAHHADTAISSSDEKKEKAPACHLAPVCSAYVLPVGPASVVTTKLALVLHPELHRSQYDLGSPSVVLPPPRS